MSAGDGHLRLERKQKDMADKVREGKVRCSFCHKTEDQVRKLIAGPEERIFVMNVSVSVPRSWKKNSICMIMKQITKQGSTF